MSTEITNKIAYLQQQRDQSFVAFKRAEEALNEVRNRIIALDGALQVLRELKSTNTASDSQEIIEDRKQ